MAFGRKSGETQILLRPDGHRGAKNAPGGLALQGQRLFPPGPEAQLPQDQPRAVYTASRTESEKTEPWSTSNA